MLSWTGRGKMKTKHSAGTITGEMLQETNNKEECSDAFYFSYSLIKLSILKIKDILYRII